MKPNGISNPLCAQDYISPRELRDLQNARLRAIVRHAYDNVELFRNRLNERELAPEDIRTPEDLRKLPFMTKKDLRDTYPFGLFAVPQSRIVRIHASSGTTGKPIVVGYTKEDLAVWQNVMGRSMAAAGITRDDIVQVSYGYGLFTGGLGAHYGAEGLGASVVPASGGNTRRQIMLIRDFGVNAICCTPSYFLHLIDSAEAEGIDLKSLPLRVGVFGAEPWTQGMREQMEKRAGIEAFDIYGLSELIGPGVAIECGEHRGLHIFEDCFYPEVIDPDTEEVLPDGEAGELVLTSLCKYAMPMIRYRTRDLTRIISEPCACGRTMRRIDRISNRSDDMFIIRGVNVFPSQIEAGLLRVEGATPHYRITLFTVNGMDNIAVEVELLPELYGDAERVENLRRKIAASVDSITGIRVQLKVADHRSIERSEGKAKRVIDNRTR